MLVQLLVSITKDTDLPFLPLLPLSHTFSFSWCQNGIYCSRWNVSDGCAQGGGRAEGQKLSFLFLPLSWSYASLPTLAYMRNQERDDFFQDLSGREEHRRKWLEWMFGHPTNSASNGCVPNSLFMVAPIQQLMVTYPFCSRISPIITQVCLHYWRWKYQISSVLGFLAAKVYKSPREREKLNLYPALLEANIMPFQSPKLFSYLGQYICLFFSLR